MLIGFKQPERRTRFRLSGRNRIARTREYYYSLYTTLVVKIVLFAFLWALFGTSTKVMRTGFKNISHAWRVALPAAVAIIAAIIGYQIYKNIREIVNYAKELQRTRDTGSSSKTGRT